MNKGFIFTFAFVLGAAAGSVATWKFVKTKYEQLAREEIEEVREYYASKDEPTDSYLDLLSISDTSESEPTENVPVVEDSTDLRMEYSSIASAYNTTDEGGDKPVSRREPYVISPAEFGEDDSYEPITLIYYNDGVLADTDKNRIEDIESCIGYESLNHFGEYEDDSVYVRNDDTMMEYEVLLDETNYADLDGID